MLYAGIDNHNAVIQTAVLDPDSGELPEPAAARSRCALGFAVNAAIP
jgi:hypothetical protein